MQAGPPPPYESVMQDSGAGTSYFHGAGIVSNKEFKIEVSDPVKQGDGVQAYVSYKVSTKTTHPSYDKPFYESVRRFRDFAWLHDKLQEKNKGVRQSLARRRAPADRPNRARWRSSRGLMQRTHGWTHMMHTQVIIPPLPEKNTVQKFQMSTDFIEQRRRALQVGQAACSPTGSPTGHHRPRMRGCGRVLCSMRAGSAVCGAEPSMLFLPRLAGPRSL